MSDTKPAAKRRRGRGRRLLKVVLCLALAGLVILIVIPLLPFYDCILTRQLICLSNVKQVALATLIYAEEHGGRLPLAPSWQEAVAPYLGTSASLRLTCPTTEKPYVYNDKLAGYLAYPVPSLEAPPLLWDAATDEGSAPHLSNVRHTPFGFVELPWDKPEFNVGYADGHAWTVGEHQFYEIMRKLTSDPGYGGDSAGSNPAKATAP